MPDEKVSTTDAVVDNALSAAAGTRQAAKWIASALGALPGLTIITTLIRAPDAGINVLLLVFGVLIAAAGAYLGTLVFGDVMAPVPLRDVDLTRYDMSLIPGQPYETYAELQADLSNARKARNDARHQANNAKVISAGAVGEAELAEKYAKGLEDRATKDPALKEQAKEAREVAREKQAAATAASGDTAAKEQQAVIWDKQLQGLEDIRAQAFKLKASEVVGARYNLAKLVGIAAVGLVAAGVILLALAPKTAPAETPGPAGVSLVTLNLLTAGQDALDCKAESVQALRIGGSDDAPLVITLSTRTCPEAKLVTFTTAQPEPLGTVESVEPVTLPPAPSPS